MLFQDYPDILSVQQLQEALGVGRSWAYKLLEQEKIRYFRIGRTYKIPKAALIEFIRNQAA
ncbi:helix-turn-helix domain-containing protein [Oscillospiraceae bacterium PP1C4]